MLKFGLTSATDYHGAKRSRWKRRVSWQLLRTPIPPSAADVTAFEGIVRGLQLSSGVFRTTFRGRFLTLDPHVNRILAELYSADAPLRVEDWAASDCLTSKEWAATLLTEFPHASLEASDLTLYLVEVIHNNESFIVEPGGQLLQSIRPPFVLNCHPPEPWFLPVNHLLMRASVRRWAAIRDTVGPLPDWSLGHCRGDCERPPFRLRQIPLIHPEAEALRRTTSTFTIRRHSVFEPAAVPCHVIRTMNIFNLSYFSPERLRDGIEAVFASLLPEGVWIVGRTLDDDGRLHTASILRKSGDCFQLLERTGSGSEIEALALSRGR
jgi:hypothetical protein